MAEKKRTKKDRTRKKSSEKEKISEIYEIDKGEKEEVVEKKGEIEEIEIKKGQKEKENRTLVGMLIFFGVFFIFVAVYFLAAGSMNEFNYHGVKFTIIHQGELTFYQTSFPVVYQGNQTVYNIYMRKDPRKLAKSVLAPDTPIPVITTVLNMTEEFNCNGDQVIAIANLANMYAALGKKIMRDENATCDPYGRYNYITIEHGNQTRIDQLGPGCYDIKIKDCEILEGTERLIDSMLIDINSNTK